MEAEGGEGRDWRVWIDQGNIQPSFLEQQLEAEGKGLFVL